MNPYLDCTLALLALINPVSKIFIVSTLSEETSPEQLRKVIIRASLVAAGILILFVLVGTGLLKYVFRVQLYSFKIIGGFVLVFRGFQALNKGIFFEQALNQRLEDISMVPLASPMIAGPATITAAISFPVHYGDWVTAISLLVAIYINLLIMLSTKSINRFLSKYNLAGALIRITGLIVATIGAQMMLDGLAAYFMTV